MASLPLHEAVEANSKDQVRQLLESHPKAINDRDSRGATPLFLAVSLGNAALAKVLLESGARVNAKTRKNWTPLHAAASVGDEDTTRALLSAGAGINRGTCRRQTPFMVACKHRKANLAKLLLETPGCDINEQDSFMRGYLHWAIKTCDLDLVKRVVARGPDMEDVDAWIKTPLYACVRVNSPELLKYIFKEGAKNLKQNDRYGRTPMHLAASRSYIECMEVLRSLGADVNVKMRNGTTPLMMAAEACRINSVKWLLSHGAKLDEADKFGSTALHRVMLEYVNLRMREESTGRRWEAMILTLLQFNPQINLETKRNVFWDAADKGPHTVLEITTKAGLMTLSQMLCLSGSLPAKLPQYYNTPPENLPSAFKQDSTVLKWVESFFNSPCPLKLLCRHFIRSHLGGQVPEAVPKLPLPAPMRSYLHLEDLRQLAGVSVDDEDDDVASLCSSEDEYEPSACDSDTYGDASPIDTDDES